MSITLVISFISLKQYVWVHLQDPLKDRVQSADLFKVELNESPRNEPVLLESEVDILHGGFSE
jgi:hypothetical protein